MMRFTRLFNAFFKSEQVGGILLFVCAVISVLLANSNIQTGYLAFWKTAVAGHPLDHWINEGLMAIFFLLIGLELKREVYAGRLSDIKSALLPIFAAVGGMLVPAGIHFLFNHGTATQAGAGIPIATDIAFAIGVLSLLGRRVPLSLKIFLTALAVIDDLGAILTIAVFYGSGISMLYLVAALAIFFLLLILNRFKVQHPVPYLISGICMWYFMSHSGIHATIAGVLLAFAMPFSKDNERSVSYRLQRFLHKPVAFFIPPLFAIANTAIAINPSFAGELFTANSLGIFFGLFLGKPLGILLFALLAVTAGICTKPADIQWKHMIGIGLLGGIGFTMSIFVTLLAFSDSGTIDASKITIIIASLVSAFSGLFLLRITLPKADHHARP